MSSSSSLQPLLQNAVAEVFNSASDLLTEPLGYVGPDGFACGQRVRCDETSVSSIGDREASSVFARKDDELVVALLLDRGRQVVDQMLVRAHVLVPFSQFSIHFPQRLTGCRGHCNAHDQSAPFVVRF